MLRRIWGAMLNGIDAQFELLDHLSDRTMPNNRFEKAEQESAKFGANKPAPHRTK